MNSYDFYLNSLYRKIKINNSDKFGIESFLQKLDEEGAALFVSGSTDFYFSFEAWRVNGG